MSTLMWSKIILNTKKDNLENGFLKPEYPFKFYSCQNYHSVNLDFVSIPTAVDANYMLIKAKAAQCSVID